MGEEETRLSLVEQEVCYMKSAVEVLTAKVATLESKYTDLFVAFSVLKAQIAVWAAIGGCLGTVAINLIPKLITGTLGF